MNLRKKFTGFALGLALMLGAGGVFAANGILKEAVGVKAASDTTSYSLITSTDDLIAGKSYIFTNGVSGTVKAMATTDNTNNRKETPVIISDGKIVRGSDVLSVTLGGSSGAWTFQTENYGGNAGYFASSSSSNKNCLLVQSIAGTATISFDTDTGAAVVKIGPNSSRNIIRYNSSSSASGGLIFSCYSSGQSAVYLWKEVEETVTDSPLSSISLSDQSTEYYTGDEFSFDGKCTATFEDGSSRLVTPTSVTEPDMATVGMKTITVSYTDPNDSTNTKTAEYTINVAQYPYEGRGTEADPYTVSDAYAIAGELVEGANNGKVVYVKGVVTTESITVSSSKATFEITDGNKTIKAYLISGVTNDSSKDSYVAHNYRVVVGGALINYSGTLEVGFASGYSSSLVSSKAPATLTLNVPETLDFNTNGTFTATTDGANPNITWSSSNEDLCTIDNDGSYLAGETTGKVTVTASLTYDDCIIPIEASKEIEIVDPRVHNVTLIGDSTVKVGKTIQLTAECSKGDEITWTSSSVENATVSETGLVTGVAEGSVTITAKCANGDEATKTITIEPKDVLFKKATSVDDLVVGKEVVIASSDGEYVMNTTQNTNNRGADKATIDGKYIVKTDTTAVFTLLPAKNNGYAFYDATNGAMLASNSSSSNILKTDGDYGGENAYATVSFATASDSSITTSVGFQGSYTRNLLKKNSSSMLFSCYGSGQAEIAIYVAIEGDPVTLGDTWAKQFKTTANCDLTGVRTLSSGTWATLTNEFKNQSIPEKMAASYLDLNSGVATTDFVNAINSYEHCLTKYGYDGFINDRDMSTNSASNKIHLTDDSDSTILATVLAYFTGTAAVGVYFFWRKRKHA